MSSDITNADVINFKNIKKKLKLSMGKLISANKWKSKNPEASEEDFTRYLLGVEDGVDVKEYLAQRLTESEIESIGKFVKL